MSQRESLNWNFKNLGNNNNTFFKISETIAKTNDKIEKMIQRRMQSSVQSVQSFSCVWLFATPWTAAARPPCPSSTPSVYKSSCPLSRWCHPTISSSVVPFSSRLQSFQVSGHFQMSQFFTSGGQSIGVSASTSVLPMNIQDWFPIRWTGWMSLQSKGLSRVFSNTTIQKHQFFGTQLSL